MKNILLGFLLFAASCGTTSQSSEESVLRADAVRASTNAIYHWKTTFEPDNSELDFLGRHDVGRIYLRMFDVATEQNYETGALDIVPIATTRFLCEIPDSTEIVPTVYITLDALRAMNGREAVFAELITERLLAMANYNGCGLIGEIQFDCDWTTTTRRSYAALCRAAKNRLEPLHIALSVTVRLHQLSEEAPPADRGVLMLYNTGAIKDSSTYNSILDPKDCIPYLTKQRYGIPLDFAYPVFGWGVWFRNGKFQAILRMTDFENNRLYRREAKGIYRVKHPHTADGKQLVVGDEIRMERPSAVEVLQVKALVERALGTPYRNNILYHFDNNQLSYYTDHEISCIYSLD